MLDSPPQLSGAVSAAQFEGEIGRLALSDSRTCVALLSLDGALEHISPGGLAALEVDDFGALRGLSWAEFWPKAARPAALEALAAATAGSVGRFAAARPTATGAPRWWDVQLTPLPGPGGEPQALVAIARDVTDLQAADVAVRASEELLRISQAASGIGSFELLPETGRIIVSEQFCRLWGVPPLGEVDVAFFLDLIHPEDRVRLVTGRTALPESALEYVEYRIVRPDTGELRWIARKGEAIRDESGRKRHFGACYDITERKTAEEQRRLSEQRLTQTEARFHQLAELAPAVIWFGNPDGTLSYLNSYWTEYTGQSLEEALPLGWSAAIHPDDQARLAEVWADARARGVLYEIEARLRRHDGVYRWFLMRAQPLRDDSGAVTGWFGADSDIDDQKSAERALAELNATLEQRVAERTADRDRMWRLSTDVMLVADFEGRIEAVNPAWTELLGWREQELIGASFLHLVHPDDMAATMAEVAKLEQGVRTFRFENRYRKKDGGYVWLSWTAAPDERFIHAVGRDIDAEKAAAQELQRAQEALRQSQKMEAVGQLTGGVAHDFNNLLTVIIGGLDTIRRCRPGDEARLKRATDMALQGAQRAASLTGRLLAFSRRQPLDPKPLDLNLLVRDMTDLLHRTLGEQIELEGVLAPRLWAAEVDQNQLESAILNLAVNARDAMPDGGKLTIETANTALDESYAAQDAEVIPGQYVMIAVSDTGDGMSRETLSRVFEPFFTTKEVGRGTGLGLSMVYGFVKQSGGHVTIYSEEGQGTTVKLYFPRHRGAAAEAIEEEAEAPPRSSGGEVVLVVEDNPDVRAYSVQTLRELGYEVLEAAEADAALAILSSEARVDLLFTDVVLPGRSGRVIADAARELRPGLKVLFTTGYSRNAIVHHGRLDPGVQLISKPFTFDQLAARVRDLLDAG